MAFYGRKILSRTVLRRGKGSNPFSLVDYCSNEYQSLLRKNNILCSMSRKGNCFDNTCAETFFSTIKCEMLYNNKYTTREAARRDILWYIEVFYNRKRRHQALNYLTPYEFKQRYFKGLVA
ncbi:IS3 family transposase [Pseudobacteroides sp.]|uniref:IS3 family transposase n=1 Tax=Pseudobacteroides sp. TaxID=1968840 RepID=UPI0039C954A8